MGHVQTDYTGQLTETCTTPHSDTTKCEQLEAVINVWKGAGLPDIFLTDELLGSK